MKLKPSILRDLASVETANAGLNLETFQDKDALHNLLSPDDEVYLEDNVQRIRLSFGSQYENVRKSSIVTGIVVGVRGYEPKDDPGKSLSCSSDTQLHKRW